MVNNIEYESPLGKSDHCVITFTYECYAILNSKRKQRKLYDKADFEKIREEINNIDWEDQLGKYNNVEDMWKFFHSTIMEIEEKFIPTRSNRNRKKKGKYPLDKKTQDKINLKHKLCKKVIAKRGSTDRKEYENLRHQYN